MPSPYSNAVRQINPVRMTPRLKTIGLRICESAKHEDHSMSERLKASESLLAELGWLTIQWARLEGYIDLISAYMLQNFSLSNSKISSSFSGRVKYIRRSLRHHAFINFYNEARDLLDLASAVSQERNSLVHGIVTSWASDSSAVRTVIRQIDNNYVAFQDLPVEEAQVADLCKRIRVVSSKLFRLLENIKSTARLLKHEESFWMVAILQVPDD